VARCKWLSS